MRDIYQNWVFDRLHGRVNPRKTGDLAIDGWVELNVPTQVKQSERVGRVDVDKLETAIERHFDTTKGMRGYLIGFSFTRDAHEEVLGLKITKRWKLN